MTNESPPLCARCETRPAGLERPPFSGPLGAELTRRICVDCWNEWRRVEVMVINELKLNFMEPSSQDVLAAEMRRFLGLDGAPGAEPAKNPDPR
ncbi:MAG: Fe(2+)-trafficking protein [Thermoanaerobaculia bacterium]